MVRGNRERKRERREGDSEIRLGGDG